MGMFDTVLVKCPSCGTRNEFQTKSGECCLLVHNLEDCPDDMLGDVNRHAPVACDECGTIFQVDIPTRTSVKA